MVFFKNKDGALIPFTAPLVREVFSVNWPDEETKHRGFRITCHGKIVCSYVTTKYRNLMPAADTALTYICEAIEEAIEDGEINIIINAKEIVEDLVDALN